MKPCLASAKSSPQFFSSSCWNDSGRVGVKTPLRKRKGKKDTPWRNKQQEKKKKKKRKKKRRKEKKRQEKKKKIAKKKSKPKKEEKKTETLGLWMRLYCGWPFWCTDVDAVLRNDFQLKLFNCHCNHALGNGEDSFEIKCRFNQWILTGMSVDLALRNQIEVDCWLQKWD